MQMYRTVRLAEGLYECKVCIETLFFLGGGLTFVFLEVRKGNFYQNSQLILLETSDEN